uniref:Putative calcineurin-like phosphoesterase n=1 Tax=viral metagenome TaxID=1070528 RepID=A0A6M3LGP1_9ZZZZ
MEEKDGDKVVLKIIQISDLHITSFRNLLSPMVESINREQVDLVVVTGDITHRSDDKELFKEASDTLNKIRHRVVSIPGDYDSGELWKEYFGDGRMKTFNLNGFCLDFLDTSFMGHRYAVGWGDVLKEEDPEQYEWFREQVKLDKYHIVFSHHPFWTQPTKEGDEYLCDNIRSVYSGHSHEPIKFYFKYDKPRSHFPHGFTCVPMKFHGNACYMVILVKANGEMINFPRVINAKRTAW